MPANGFFSACSADGCAAACGLSDPRHDTVRVDLGFLDDKENAGPQNKVNQSSSLPVTSMVPHGVDKPHAVLWAERSRDQEQRRAPVEVRAGRGVVGHDSPVSLSAIDAAQAYGDVEELERAEIMRAEQQRQEKEKRRMADELQHQQDLERQRRASERREQQREARERVKKEEEEQRLKKEEEEAQVKVQESARLEEQKKQRMEADRRHLQDFLKLHGFSTEDVNQKRTKFWKTKYALHSAVKQNSPELVDMLIAAGADPFLRNSTGETPLQLAKKLNKSGAYLTVIRKLSQAPQPGAGVRRRA